MYEHKYVSSEGLTLRITRGITNIGKSLLLRRAAVLFAEPEISKISGSYRFTPLTVRSY